MSDEDSSPLPTQIIINLKAYKLLKPLKVTQNEAVSRANHARKGTRYHKPRREIALKEIRRLLITEGLTNDQLAERLHIPLKSIQRYISQLYNNDNQLLESLDSAQETLTQWRICQDRLDSHRQEILENIARNPAVAYSDKLRAWNLVCELSAATLRLRHEIISYVARRNGGSLPVMKQAALMLLQKNKENDDTTDTTDTTTTTTAEAEEAQKYDITVAPDA